MEHHRTVFSARFAATTVVLAAAAWICWFCLLYSASSSFARFTPAWTFSATFGICAGATRGKREEHRQSQYAHITVSLFSSMRVVCLFFH